MDNTNNALARLTELRNQQRQNQKPYTSVENRPADNTEARRIELPEPESQSNEKPEQLELFSSDSGESTQARSQSEVPSPTPRENKPAPSPSQAQPVSSFTDKDFANSEFNFDEVDLDLYGDGTTPPTPKKKPEPQPTPAPTETPKRAELVKFDDEDDILPDQYSPATTTPRREIATTGMKGALNRLLGTSLMVESTGPVVDPDHLRSINRPLRYPQVIGVVGSKGGVGKSSTTQMLGSALSRYRKQRGIAALDLDANSSLIHLTQSTTPLTQQRRTSIHTLAHDDSINSASDVNSHLVFNTDGLAVLPGVAWSYHNPVTPDEFVSALEKVARYYSTILVDFPGSEEVPSAMAAMDMLDAIVYVAEVSPVAVNLAKPSLARINQTRPDLISSATVLLNRGTHPTLDSQVADIDRHVEKIEKLSTSGNLRVMEVLHDPHLGEASRLELDRVESYTHDRFVEIAARVVDNLPGEEPRFMSRLGG